MYKDLKVKVINEQPSATSYIKTMYQVEDKNLGKFCLDFCEKVFRESNPVAYAEIKRREEQRAREYRRSSIEAEKRRLEEILLEMENSEKNLINKN